MSCLGFSGQFSTNYFFHHHTLFFTSFVVPHRLTLVKMIKFLWNPALFLRRFKQHVPFAEAELISAFLSTIFCFLATAILKAL
jgi:hypothetical protein